MAYEVYSLLTPKQVAELLQVTLQTVYDNQARLGGFYPAGIRVLRFRREDIENIMKGSRNQILRNPSRDEQWYESRGRRVPLTIVRRNRAKEIDHQIKVVKDLVARAPKFADCKLVTDVLRMEKSRKQRKKKDEKKES